MIRTFSRAARSRLTLAMLIAGTGALAAAGVWWYGDLVLASEPTACGEASVISDFSSTGVCEDLPAAPAIQPAPLITIASVQAPNGQNFAYALRSANQIVLPGEVDSSSPVYWWGDIMSTFTSAGRPAMSYGTSQYMLADPTLVGCMDCPSGGLWMESVWYEEETGTLYGWYHLEPDTLECQTAPRIGAAVSYNDGHTWWNSGIVLENPHAEDCEYDNGYFTGGNGDFSVILDANKEYFYFLFSNYGGAIDEQGVGVARSKFEDRGQPETVFKYHEGKWEEEGVGGYLTPLFPTPTGWKGPIVDSFWGPSVHWNTHLNAYVMLLNRAGGTGWHQEGIYLAVSHDLVNWSTPRKVLDSPYWYPQVIGLGPNETETMAGQFARLYVGGKSSHILEFVRPGEAPVGFTDAAYRDYVPLPLRGEIPPDESQMLWPELEPESEMNETFVLAEDAGGAVAP